MPPYFSAFAPLSSEHQALLLPDGLPRLCEPDPGPSNPDSAPLSATLLSSTSSPSAVVVCLHGFSGLPYELYPALDGMAKAGLAGACPLLPRHGFRESAMQHREFALLNQTELLDAARAEIALARQRYGRVGLMGFSMGGAIALILAAEGLVDACAVLAPALRLPLKAEILIPLLGWADFEVAAPSQEPFYFPKYEFHHARSLRALWQLANLARRQLPKIDCPLQVLQSRGDRVIHPRVVRLIQRQVSVPLETVWFEQSGHIMLRDSDGAAVAEALARFFQRQLLGEAGTALQT